MNTDTIVTKFEAYLLTQRRVARNTFHAYKKDIEQLVAFLKRRSLTLESVTGKDLKEFLKYLRKKGIAPRSMARKISAIKVFFAYLDEHYDYEDVAQDLVFPKLEKKLPRYCSEEQIQELFEQASLDDSTIGARNKVMLYLLYVSGMRISEMINLKITNIYFDTGVIDVVGKGGKGRQIPLPAGMVAMLSEYVENIHPTLIYKRGDSTTTDYLFPVRYGSKIKPITRQSFWIILKKMAKNTSIPDTLSPHQLRHSLATHMLKNGADLRSLQMLLGHGALETVQIYTHLETDHLREMYDKKHPRSK